MFYKLTEYTLTTLQTEWFDSWLSRGIFYIARPRFSWKKRLGVSGFQYIGVVVELRVALKARRKVRSITLV